FFFRTEAYRDLAPPPTPDDLHSRAEPPGELLLRIACERIAVPGPFEFGSLRERRDPPFSLPDRQGPPDYLLRQQFLIVRRGKSDQRTSVACRKLSASNPLTHARRQFEKSQAVGDAGPVLSDTASDLLLSELKFLLEPRVSRRRLQGIQVLALEVLDERDLQKLLV